MGIERLFYTFLQIGTVLFHLIFRYTIYVKIANYNQFIITQLSLVKHSGIRQFLDSTFQKFSHFFNHHQVIPAGMLGLDQVLKK